MAIDVYLQIDGIKGESADTVHKGWIEIATAHWGVVQPRSATASTGGGHNISLAGGGKFKPHSSHSLEVKAGT